MGHCTTYAKHSQVERSMKRPKAMHAFTVKRTVIVHCKTSLKGGGRSWQWNLSNLNEIPIKRMRQNTPILQCRLEENALMHVIERGATLCKVKFDSI